jgi:hypothetical protein
MRTAVFTAVLVSLLGVSATAGQHAAKPDTSSSRSKHIKLAGTYSSEIDFQGGNYKVTYSFAGNAYSSKLLFENEPVSECNGTFELSPSKLTKRNRVFTFVREESPGAPEKKDDVELDIKNLTDSGFEMKLTKESEEGFSDTVWVDLKKQ